MFYFDQSPAVLTTIVGGSQADTFPIYSTVALDRVAFDAADGLIAVETVQNGVSMSKPEIQHIDVRDGKVDTENSFTLTFTKADGTTQTTAVSLAFTATAKDVQNALQALSDIGVGNVNVTGGSGVFTVTFSSSLGDVAQLLATHVGKLVSGSTQTDGCDGASGCGAAQDEIQHLKIDAAKTGGNGFFTIQMGFQETKALQLNASATDIANAIKAAFTDINASGTLVSVLTEPGGFAVKFSSAAGNVPQMIPVLMPLYLDGGAGTDQLDVQSLYEDMYFNGNTQSDSANVNLNATTLAPFHPSDLVGHISVTETQAGNGSQDEIQRVALTDVTGGSFELAFGGIFTGPIAWDAPATGPLACVTLSDKVTKYCSVQAALAALSTIGVDAHGAPNVGVTRSPIDGSYTIEFIGNLKNAGEALLQTNVAVAETQVGGGGHNETQTVTLQNTSPGQTFSLDYTYPLQPLGVALDPNAVGSLLPGTYFYEVTALTTVSPHGESLPSAEVSTQVGTNGAITITWGDVPGATGYRIYRGMNASGTEAGYFSSATASFFDDGSVGLTGSSTPPNVTKATGVQTTVPIAVNADPSVVQAALEALPSIGAGNVQVTIGLPGHYTITFIGALANTPAAALLVGNTSSLRSNGVHAIATLDGGEDPDTYDINLIGGVTSSLVNVYDSGTSGGDSLTVNGTDNADVFLMRAQTSADGSAFVALINGPTPLTPSPGDPYERVNYNGALESITINGGNGDDQFYIDDTRSSITVNGDEGNDFFQVGQLYKSRRTPQLAGVAPGDVFATIDTTQGWLSNGISKPMTINGGIGDDNFIVFHNLDTLDLNGDAGNDTFLVQAFALAGSQEDHRALTDLSGGAGADHIQYAVNAPVNIDGGDGFDTVIVIGTEFNDDFVITPTGVFGAGLNVNFVNIEALVVDGGAGDDRFFVLGTGPNFTTEIDGGLGSDAVFVEGPTPVNGVISNTLLGHSGIITNSVESSAPLSSYNGIPVIGVSANVADNDTPGIVVVQTNGGSQVIQTSTPGSFSLSNGTEDSFAVVLTRPPDPGTSVVVDITPPQGLVLLTDGSGNPLVNGTPFEQIQSETQAITLTNFTSGHFTLTFSGQTTSSLAWNAAASDVQAALNALSNIGGVGGTVTVTRTGTSYAITFGGTLAATQVAQITATLQGDADSLASTSVQTTVDGGFSKATGIALTFDTTPGHLWYEPQNVYFVVDDHAPTIGSNVDFQNAVDSTVPGSTITGNVIHAVSVDMNPATTGDEYATLTAATPVFAADLPSATLPEGLRGEHLKITGSDPEAEGQVELILGSYLTNVSLGGATGGTFTLSFGTDTTGALAWNISAADMQAALEALPSIGAGNVSVTLDGSGYHIALRGTLYLTNDVHFTVNGAGLTGGSATSAIDASSVKLASAWSVEPQPPAVFEVGLYSDVHVPDVKVKVYSQATPSVVVFESDGSTAVDQERLERCHPGAPVLAADRPRDGQPRRQRRRADLLQPESGRQQPGHLAVVRDEHLEHVPDRLRQRRRRRRHPQLPSRRSRRHRDRADALQLVPLDRHHRRRQLSGRHRQRVRRLDERDRVLGRRLRRLAGDRRRRQLPVPGQLHAGADDEAGCERDRDRHRPRRSRRGRRRPAASSPSRSSSTCRSTEITWRPSVDVHFNVDGSGGNHQWNVPVTVYVRAHENDRVDGGDTKVFAQQLAQLNAIQGPLFVNGGEGADRTGLLEREPVMLPGEKNLTPSMGLVITSTPGTLDNTIAATVTIEHSQLATISIEADVGTNNSVQEVAVNATTGTFTLSYNGHTTGALAFDAPSVTVEDALRPFIQGYDPSADVTVAQNGNVYQVTILHPSLTPLTLGHDDSSLGPLTPGQLVNETILITQGPAKNKTRIVTGAIDNHDNVNPRLTTWTLTLDKPWFSPFTQDGIDADLGQPVHADVDEPEPARQRGDAGEPALPVRHRQPGVVRRHRQPVDESEPPHGCGVRLGSDLLRPEPVRPQERVRHRQPARPVPHHRIRHGRQPLRRRPGRADQRLGRRGERLQRSRRRERARRHHVPADHRPPTRARERRQPRDRRHVHERARRLARAADADRHRRRERRRRREGDHGAHDGEPRRRQRHAQRAQRRPDADRARCSAHRQRRQPAGDRDQLRQRLGAAGHLGRPGRRDPDPHRPGDRRELHADPERAHDGADPLECAGDGRRQRPGGARRDRRRNRELRRPACRRHLPDPLPERARRPGRAAARHRPDRAHERRGREGRPQHQRHRRDRRRRGAADVDVAHRARHAGLERDAAARGRRHLRQLHAHLQLRGASRRT